MKITGEKAAQAMEELCATGVFQSCTKKDISVDAWGSDAKGTKKKNVARKVVWKVRCSTQLKV